METQTPTGAKIAKGASYLFLQGITTNLCSFIFLTLATRILTTTNIGAISALGITATLFTTIGTFSIPSAATKYISESLGKGNQRTAKEIYTKALKFGLLTSIALSAICLALPTTIAQLVLNDPSLQPIIITLALDIGALIFNTFLNGILFGLQKFRLIALIGTTIGIIRLIGSIILLIANMNILGVTYGWVIADLTGTLILLYFTSSSFKQEKSSNENSNQFPFNQLFTYALPLYGASIVAYFSVTIDKIIVLSFSNLAALGIYSIAIAAVNVVGIVSSSISLTLFPQFAQMQGQYGTHALKDASIKVSRYVFLIFTPLAIGLVATAYPTIQLFFGENYASGWSSVAIVSTATALTSATIIIGNLLLSTGMTRTVLEANIFGVAIGAITSALLVSPLGSIGAAIGRATLLSTSFIYSAYKLKNTVGLHLDNDALKKSLISSSAMAVSVIATQLVLNSRYMLPLYIAIGGIVYFLMLRLLKAVTNADIQLLNDTLPSPLHGFVSLFAKFFSQRETEIGNRDNNL